MSRREAPLSLGTRKPKASGVSLIALSAFQRVLLVLPLLVILWLAVTWALGGEP
jgi:hypothetical protein